MKSVALANTTNNAVGAYDVRQVTTRYASNWLILVMHFAKPVASLGQQNPAVKGR